MNNKSVVFISGWSVFLLSFIVYVLMLEPTTSFWDCSEFILSASGLQVNHPSGAPLFMLIGRLFSLLSFGNPQKIAWAVNLGSAFFSALTVYFLFHIIYLFSKKLESNLFLCIGSALLGSLTYAFTDSFWFSAVESEVYALSMFFLVLAFWGILKWDENYGAPRNSKWLLFIALISGLGLGVHLLNLLIIPTIVMLIIIRQKGFSYKTLLLSAVIGFFVLIFILYMLTPLYLSYLSYFDLVFVNSFHLPVNSGLIVGIGLLAIVSLVLIRFLERKNKQFLLIGYQSIVLILVGFSVYAVTLIRSQAGTPVNFGEPNNIFSLVDYLNREQYPKRPLIKGENFNSVIVGLENRTTKKLFDGKYEEIELPASYTYSPETIGLFPRMYSNSPEHIRAYKDWVNIKGKPVRVNGRGENKVVRIPTFRENLQFFFRFQLNQMYVRYFMWNFVGRQNDDLGRGEITRGNWLSGINFLDSIRLGNQDVLSDQTENKSKNTYFFLPLFIGLIGMAYHYLNRKSDFYYILVLFIMAGVGLVVYINEIPIVPRERDYVFVGSFLAFCIWIGLSYLGLYKLLSKKISAGYISYVLLLILMLCSPVLLISQNYDDHDRSDRFAARDFAANILNSCPENAILFTSGDNDTYPLLYCQEVEKIRRDVRIVIMPFLGANWFIDQLKDKKYDDEGLKMMLPQNKIDEDALAYIPVLPEIKRPTNFESVLKFVASDNEKSKRRTTDGQTIDFIPANELYISVVADSLMGDVPISIKLKKHMYKHELAFWDIISSNAQSRPICFVSKMEAYKHDLLKYTRLEGLVCRLVPKTNSLKNWGEDLPCDTEKLYSQLMDSFSWGNVNDPKVFVDYNTIYNANVFQLRSTFNLLAKNLIQQGDLQRAERVIDKCVEMLPVPVIPLDLSYINTIELMFRAGMQKEAEEQLELLVEPTIQKFDYYNSLSKTQAASAFQDIREDLYFLEKFTKIIDKNGLQERFPKVKSAFAENLSVMQQKGVLSL